jgi:L-alanine-DL-glutamate epimerase-like enolase superfamily enzyme
VNVSVRTIELHLAVPFAISRATHTTKKVVIVELREGERVSRGEGVPDAFFGETPETVERDIRTAIAELPDDPLDLALLAERLSIQFPHGGAGCCAVDILAHDRAAQVAGAPLRVFLGLAPADPPPTSFTIGIADPTVMAERAARAADVGFGVLKVKLGRDDDVAALTAIRERFFGTIRVDPNAAWTAAEAPERIARIVRFGIEFVEQPIAPDDTDVARVADACDGINVKLQKCGGVAAARAMIAAAHERGLKVMLGCRAAETSVGIAAAAHLAPSVEWADLDGNLLITDDPFRAVAVERGRFVYPDRPGLGALPA